MGRKSEITLDTIYYRYKGVEAQEERAEGDEPAGPQVKEKSVKVRVCLIKEFDTNYEGERRPVKTMSLKLVCDEPEFVICGSDIDALRVAVWERLDKEFEVKWSNYLMVTVEPAFIYDGTGAGVIVKHKRVEKGVAHDRTLLLREWRGSKMWIGPWPEEFKDTNGRLVACIPETEENREALKTFSEMMERLRKDMRDRFSPSKIEETMRALAGMSLALSASAAALQEGLAG